MYLENNICKLTPLFNIDYSKKKNLLCGSFFKIAGGGYKDLTYYLYKFENSLKIYKKYLPDFTFRLFIDNSIYKDSTLMNRLKKLKNVEMVLFECIDYVKDLDYHRGIFGMIVRFFPLFDFENNDANIVIICDLDFHKHDVHNLLNLKKMITSLKSYDLNDKIDFYFIGYPGSYGNFVFKDVKFLNGKKIIPYFSSMQIITFKKFNKNSIEDYIINYKKYHEEILDGYNYLSNQKVEKSNDEFIFYGWDEYFLNHQLINDNINRPFGAKISINLGENIYHIARRSKNDKKIKEYFINFLNYIADEEKLVNEEDFVKELKELFFEKITLRTSLKDKEVKICSKIYEYYIKNYKDEMMLKYFYKDFINIILSDYYIGKVLFEESKFYNTSLDSINFNYLTLPKEELVKLKELKIKYNLPKVLY